MLRQLQIAAIVIVIVHAFAKLVDVGEGFFCADVDIALPLFSAERALEECQICDCDSVANVVVIAVFIVVVFIAAIIVVVVVE